MKPVRTIHHIGIAVRSIEEQIPYYTQVLGAEFEGVESVVDQQVRVGFFRFQSMRIELLEPTDPTGPVARFLDKRGPGLHHVALLVDDLPARIAELKQAGLKMIDEAPRPGAHGMNVAFVHPQSTFGVLTELCEPSAANVRRHA